MVTHVSWGFRFRSSGGEFKTRRAAFRCKMWSGETGGGRGEREASLWWLTHLNPLTSGTDFSFWKSAWINRLGFRVAGDLRKWKLSAFCTGFKERFYRVSWSFGEGPTPPSPPPYPTSSHRNRRVLSLCITISFFEYSTRFKQHPFHNYC